MEQAGVKDVASGHGYVVGRGGRNTVDGDQKKSSTGEAGDRGETQRSSPGARRGWLGRLGKTDVGEFVDGARGGWRRIREAGVVLGAARLDCLLVKT
jgi:hypothetical protein